MIDLDLRRAHLTPSVFPSGTPTSYNPRKVSLVSVSGNEHVDCDATADCVRLVRHMPTTTGPWWYIAPPGQQVIVDRPTEVPIRDEAGNLTGANNWKGLLHELELLLFDIQKQGLYTRHECRLCCQKVTMWGQELSVRGAVCDGLTAVRREKCATYRCTNSRSGKRGSRWERSLW